VGIWIGGGVEVAVRVRAVAAERSDVLLPRHGEQLGLGIVVLDDPAFGPVLDGEKVGVEGVCDGVAVSDGLDRGPDCAVVGKHVEVVFHNIPKVVNENNEQKRGKDAALGDSGGQGLEAGSRRANENSLLAVGQIRAEPRQQRTRDTSTLKLKQDTVVPNLVKSLGDIQRKGTDLTSRVECVHPTLGHVHEEIQGLVAGAKAKLPWVEERSEKAFEVGCDKGLKDLADDGEEGDGTIVSNLAVGFLLVEGDDICDLPKVRKISFFQTQTKDMGEVRGEDVCAFPKEDSRELVRACGFGDLETFEMAADSASADFDVREVMIGGMLWR